MQKPGIPSGEFSAIREPQLGGGAVMLYPPVALAQRPKTLTRTADIRMNERKSFLGSVHMRDSDVLEYRAVDLSVGGVGMIGTRRLGVGRVVEVAFLNRGMVVKGVIRSERESALPRWRIGIQFLQPQPELLAVALAGVASAG
jgi:hypothetical protein